MPRVSRSAGPVFANAAPAYATDASTLNANRPLANGACSLPQVGPLASAATRSSACCTQKPAEEIDELSSGRQAAAVGDREERDAVEVDLAEGPASRRTPGQRRRGRLRGRQGQWRRLPRKMQDLFRSWTPSPTAEVPAALRHAPPLNPSNRQKTQDYRPPADSRGRRPVDTAQPLLVHAGLNRAGTRPCDKETDMLETIAIILIVLWLLGMVSGYTLGNFIYVLLVIAIVLFLVRLISGRRV